MEVRVLSAALETAMINQTAHRARLQISDLIDAKIELVLLRDMGVPSVPATADAEKQNLLITRIETIERELYSLLADL